MVVLAQSFKCASRREFERRARPAVDLPTVCPPADVAMIDSPHLREGKSYVFCRVTFGGLNAHQQEKSWLKLDDTAGYQWMKAHRGRLSKEVAPVLRLHQNYISLPEW